jgi:hypothetical protein
MLKRMTWRLSPGAFAAWAQSVLAEDAPELAARIASA